MLAPLSMFGRDDDAIWKWENPCGMFAVAGAMGPVAIVVTADFDLHMTLNLV